MKPMNHDSRKTSKAPSLWLALHLPCLSLEANAPLPSPSAVVDHGRILLGDLAARQAGIEAGSGIPAARMLAPAITLIARNPAREEAALHTLACWAGCLTPRINLMPDALLLEVGSCLRLFGGLARIAEAAIDGIRALGFSVEAAAAPTPLGAHWLARMGTGARCTDLASLRQHLEELPLAVLPDKAATQLARFGARTLADVRRLPSADLGRRIGKETLQRIAQAFGELPDPRAGFVFPERFALPLQLPAAVENASGLVFAARRLTAALSGWLAARQSGVRGFTLQLLHRQSETPLHLQFADLTADSERFERILREKLDRLTLSAPVESIRLEAPRVETLTGRSIALFNDGHAGAATDRSDIGALLEHFSARLGEQAIYRLALQADHRPECATRRAAVLENNAPNPTRSPPRPLWLLDKPEPLGEVDGRPYRQGPLQLLAGPERIESGWWDRGETTGEENIEAVGDIRRDYFIARAPDNSWLWIFRDVRAPGGWFLHGHFS